MLAYLSSRLPGQRPLAWGRAVFEIALIGLLYYLSARLGLLFIMQPDSVTAVWPTSGLALALLVARPRSTWLRTLVAILLANLLANLAVGHSWLTSLGFMLANSAESLLIAWLVVRFIGQPLTFASARQVFSFIGIAVVGGNAFTGLLGAAVVHLSLGAPFWLVWQTWTVADGLGMMVVTPAILTWQAAIRGRALPRAPRRLAEAALVVMTLAGISLAVFQATPTRTEFWLPLTYLVFVPLLWAAARFGTPGATLAALVLAPVAVWQTARGQGPFALLATSVRDQVIEVQLFLGTATVLTLLLAAVIAERRRAEEEARARGGELRLITDAMPALISYVGADERYRFVNQHYERWFDRPSETMVGQSVREVLGSERYDQIQPYIAAALAGEPVSYDAPSVVRAGREVYVNITYIPHRADSGEVLGFFNLVQDLTERHRVEAALRASEARLRGVITTAVDGIITIDEHGVVDSVNPAAERLFGYSAAEIVGRNVAMLMPSPDRERHDDYLAHYRATGERRVIGIGREVVGQRRDGTTFPMDLAVSEVAIGGQRLFIGIVRDITARHAAEAALIASEARFATAFRASPVGILISRLSDNVIIDVNDAMLTLLGRERQALIGGTVDQDGFLTDPEQRRMLRAALATSGHFADVECIIRTGSGALRTALVSVEQIRVDGQPHALTMAHDISDRKEIERAKSEFIAVVSHELRTPLTSIRAALGMLRRGLLGEVSPRGERMLDIAINNTDRLTRLITDILDVERIELGGVGLDIQACDLADLMGRAADAVRSLAVHSGIPLSVTPLAVPIRVDPDRVVQVLTNLLGNAIKFSPRGGAVRLTAERRGDELWLRVSDQGRGIPADQLELIFDRFHQVDASDERDRGGSGLGLAICRAIVTQHGGRIWAESTVGEGSTFHVVLPAAPATAAPPSPPSTEVEAQ